MKLRAKIKYSIFIVYLLNILFCCKNEQNILIQTKNSYKSEETGDLIALKKRDSLISFNTILKNRNYKIYDIDVNNDNINDKVATNKIGNELLFFVKKDGLYTNVYKGSNYSMEGIYFVDEILPYHKNKNVCCIRNFFAGAGGQNMNYFIEYVNNDWRLRKTITYISPNEICINDIVMTNEDCISFRGSEAENTTILTNVIHCIKNKKSVNHISEELLFTLLINNKLDKKTLPQYNDIAYYLEQSKLYPEAVFLLEAIVSKFPDRMVAYINLGDAYWGNQQFKNAKNAYHKYTVMMDASDKQNKIPNRVLKRVKEMHH